MLYPVYVGMGDETQKQMAELFDKDVRTINEHVINAFEEGELEREATFRNFRMVRQ